MTFHNQQIGISENIRGENGRNKMIKERIQGKAPVQTLLRILRTIIE